MSLLDLLVVIIVGSSVAAGFVVGFARVGIGFLAAILGVVFGFWFYGVPAGWIHHYLKSIAVSNLIGFVLVFWAFLAAGALLAKLTSKLFKWTGLTWLDRLMGGAFGLVRGALIAVAMIAVLLAFTPKPMPNWMVKSQVLPYAMEASSAIASLAPNAIKDAFRESMIELRRLWDQQLRESREQLRALERSATQPKKKRKKGRVRDLLIFDLDGTLIDSKEDLVNSVNAMLAWKHCDPLPHAVVASYIGNGAPMLVKRALPGLSEDDHLAALQFFLDYYREHMLDATTLYPGVREALDRLHSECVPLAILTNKPVRFSVQLIAGLGLAGHFFQIYGGNSFEEKKPHPIGIECLIAESGADRGRTVMVGDSAVDVLTARAACVKACGVSWGFQPETFAQAPPDFIVDDLRVLAEMVLEA